MQKLKNDNRTDHLVKFDGEGIQQKKGEQDKNSNRIKARKGGSYKGKKGMILHNDSSLNNAGILNYISAPDGSVLNMQYP